MRWVFRSFVCLFALGVAACDPPQVLLSTSQLKVSVTARGTGELLVVVDPSTTSQFVDIHHRIDGSPQLNLRMTEKNGRWRHVLTDLEPGAIVDFYITYEFGGLAHDTRWLRYVLDGSCCTPTADPSPAPTPSPPTPEPTPSASTSPAPTATPPSGHTANPITPTDYTHRVAHNGQETSIIVRPFQTIGSSTVAYRVNGAAELSRTLQRNKDEWSVNVEASPGDDVEYRFFLSYSDGQNTMFLRSAWQRAVVGAPPTSRPAPITVDTAGRFRDRHENEARFEPFVAGYFEASTFAVLLLDFGNALDVSVAVADDAEFVDIKLFDTNPVPPHLRAPEVRADYRVAARMLSYDDPTTGARTWHWRQERNDATGADLAPGSLVDLEFTIRRIESQPVHEGSNGQYYTAIFRHRMGEPGLTELLVDPAARSGGATSAYVISEAEWSFAQAARNLDHEGLVTFLRGKRLFDRDLAQEEPSKLGPRYEATSCAACHVRDGSAAPPEGPGDEGDGMTVTLGIADEGDPLYGRQLQRRAVPGTLREGAFEVQWNAASGAIPDGTPYELLTPHAETHDLAFGPVASPLRLRVAPRLVGLGLLQSIPTDAILAHVDENDLDGDGISGRARLVLDETTGAQALGRFGWKADAASVKQQVARAYVLDLGMTSAAFPVDDTPAAGAASDPIEVSETDLADVSDYVSTLAVPMRIDWDDPDVQNGVEVFREVGCATCHIETFTTDAAARLTPLRGQLIQPFTDLLLHDMGPGLADPSGTDPGLEREWRTAPLWGLGRTEIVGGHSRFLHDGRARSLLEAILWHGGEAATARERFVQRSANDRRALLRFLESL